MTTAEIAVYDADVAAAQAVKDAQAAADIALSTKVAAVNAKLAGIGITVDDLMTLGLSFKALP